MSNTPNALTNLDTSFKFEKTWFFSEKKQLISLYTKIIGNQFIPLLFKLDLNTLEYVQIFPLYEEDSTAFVDVFKNLSFSALGKANITYNSLLKKYLLTYSGFDKNITSPQPFVVNFKITDWDLPKLESVDIYKDLTSFASSNTPPLVLDVNNKLVFTRVPSNTDVNVQLPILNSPTSCKIIYNNTGGSATITNDGYMTVNIPTAGTHHINFSASNAVGTTYYDATFVVINTNGLRLSTPAPSTPAPSTSLDAIVNNNIFRLGTTSMLNHILYYWDYDAGGSISEFYTIEKFTPDGNWEYWYHYRGDGNDDVLLETSTTTGAYPWLAVWPTLQVSNVQT